MTNRTKQTVRLLGLLAVVAALVTVAGCKAATTTTTAASTSGSTTATTGTATSGTGAAGGTGTTGGTTVTTGSTAESVAPVSDNFKICTQCHGDFNGFLAASKVITPNFSHAVHLNKGYKCEDCHAVPTHQPDTIVKPKMQACFKCHGQEATSKAPGACGTCHPKDFALVPASHNSGNWLPPANPGLVKTVSATHGPTAATDITYCQMCHAQSFCDNCHKTPMPHAADWQTVHPDTVKAKGEAICANCHQQQYICNDCHHAGYKPSTPWKQQHPPIVKANGAEACFKCHNPLTCAHCHITGQFTDIAPKAP
ncbi:MAG: cytochrome c3 family protein [Actinobacteria bacterium]|nr:cytochrome c3 family protein [Actinomycetota bacterium]